MSDETDIFAEPKKNTKGKVVKVVKKVEDVRKKVKVVNCNLKRNGTYYEKGAEVPKDVLFELEELGFVEEV